VTEEGIVSPESNEQEEIIEKSLRPQSLAQYIGQNKVKQELNIYIQAAKNREEALDHVLLYGPPGLGKTTMAMVIANEMAVQIKTTSGPAIEKPGDLIAVLNELQPGDVLLSMRSIACPVWQRKCCIRRWKTFMSISWLVKERPLIRFIFPYHLLP